MILVDESFLDFADDGERQSVVPLLARYPNLAVIKSMSKVYGVCGLRLGYVASADRGFIDKVRRALPIWNVNGLAEFLLRNLADHAAALKDSFRKVRQDRDQLYALLKGRAWLKVWKPDANFVLARVLDPFPATLLARELYVRHNCLVKPCGGKTMADGGKYLRIAARTAEENARLAACLDDVRARLMT